jgi:hypothetical protein
MNKESHITYNELLEVVSWGLFSLKIKGTSIHDDRLVKYTKKTVNNAIYGGIYIGSPGRDIYYMLPYLSKKQIEEVVCMVEKTFPRDPPSNHVNVGMFVRFVYGQFEKQGILRSEKDFERMKREELEWSSSRSFLKLLYDKLEENNNFYGMSILCEMEAHRLGDEAVLNKDVEKLDKMEEYYNKSVKLAHKCKSHKQMFTPYYWCYEYFRKYKEKKKALSYAYLTIENASKYCPDARPGYITKLYSCLKYIKKKDKEHWSKFYTKYSKNKKKCIKNTFKRIK